MESEVLADLELRRYLRGVFRRKWLVAGIVAVAVALSAGVSALQSPLYVATAQLELEPANTGTMFNPLGSSQVDPQVSVATEIQVIESAPVQASVVARLGSVAKVAADQVGQTLVIEVKGSAATASRAAEVANAYVTAYLDRSQQRETSSLLSAAQQLQGQMAQLQTQIDQLDANAPSSGVSPPQVSALESQRDAFAQQLSQLQVEASLASGGARLVASAAAPSGPVRPAPRRYAVLATAAGLVIGVGTALALEYLDDRIRAARDLEVVTGLPLLAAIPRFDKDRADKAASRSADPARGDAPALIAQAGRSTPASEAYRSLRTSVQLLGVAKPITVVQFTSAAPAEGKTTTVVNLAAAIASSGRSVVVVDCDLRRPCVHEVFGLSNATGLTSVLAGDALVAEAVQRLPDYEGLSVLTSGALAPNPSELLSLQRTSEVIFELQSHYDMVLLDSPPVLPVTDAVVLSEWVDGVILVASAKVTHRRVIARTVHWLTQAGAPLVGAVLNRAEAETPYQYGYGYYDQRPRRSPTRADGLRSASATRPRATKDSADRVAGPVDIGETAEAEANRAARRQKRPAQPHANGDERLAAADGGLARESQVGIETDPEAHPLHQGGS